MSDSHKARRGLQCSRTKDSVLASRSQKRAWAKAKQRENQAERSRSRQELAEEVKASEEHGTMESMITFYLDGNGVPKWIDDSTGKKGRAYGSAPIGLTLPIAEAERYIRKEDFYGKGKGANVPEKGWRPDR